MTFAIMAVIWLPQLRKLAEPGFDAEEYGIPMILYTSTASFIAWIVLVVVISPFLQLMASVFSAYAVSLFSADRMANDPAAGIPAIRGRHRT
jgi:hypothetical protein